jgi:hypothetical protein
MDQPIIVFTIAARNYLSLVSVLFDSIRAHCPGARFSCFVVDGFDSELEVPECLRTSCIDCRSLDIPRFEEMAFKYDVVEFATALKPFIFRHVLEVEGYGSAVFLDPDIKLYADLRWVEALLESRSIVVTPHILDIARNDPSRAGESPAYELRTFLLAGDFNLGFIAIRNDARGLGFVGWWASVLADQCFFDLDQGLCVDQKWVNLATGFLGNQLEILRDPGANVAFWNLHERTIAKEGEGRYLVNGSTLKFVHYSALDLSEHALANALIAGGRIREASHPAFAELYLAYAREAVEAGHRERKRDVRYRFDYFEGGLVVNRLHRRLFAALAAREDLSAPFSRSGRYYSLLERGRLLDRSPGPMNVQRSDIRNLGAKRKIVELLFSALFRLLGTRHYLALLAELRRIAVLQNNTFLLK